MVRLLSKEEVTSLHRESNQRLLSYVLKYAKDKPREVQIALLSYLRKKKLYHQLGSGLKELEFLTSLSAAEIYQCQALLKAEFQCNGGWDSHFDIGFSFVKNTIERQVGSEFFGVKRLVNIFKNMRKPYRFAPKFFGDAHRMYFEFDDRESPVNQIRQALWRHQKIKMSDEDYKSGYVMRKGRKTAIGKILNKLKQPELLTLYEKDAFRKLDTVSNGGRLLVVCRHPYDVIRMSTGRGWTSCMNLHEGAFRDKAYEHIRQGTLAVYLIDRDDMNINNPIARTLLLPYTRVSGLGLGSYVFYQASSSYGRVSIGKHANVIAQKYINTNKLRFGLYTLSRSVYDDGSETFKVFSGYSTQ